MVRMAATSKNFKAVFWDSWASQTKSLDDDYIHFGEFHFQKEFIGRFISCLIKGNKILAYEINFQS